MTEQFHPEFEKLLDISAWLRAPPHTWETATGLERAEAFELLLMEPHEGLNARKKRGPPIFSYLGPINWFQRDGNRSTEIGTEVHPRACFGIAYLLRSESRI
jgi:hypothetical protein